MSFQGMMCAAPSSCGASLSAAKAQVASLWAMSFLSSSAVRSLSMGTTTLPELMTAKYTTSHR